MNDVALILLGWLLGIFAGPLSESIRRQHRRTELSQAIRAELREFRHLLGAVVYTLQAQVGEVDRELLSWVREIKADEADLTGSETTVRVFDTLLALPDEQLSALPNNRVAEGMSLTLRTYSLPLLETAIPELVLLPLGVRREVLAIRNQLDLLNQEVPRLMSLHERTFDSSLDAGNRQVISTELEVGYRMLARRARMLADRIARFLGKM